ncbi:hypothetical protein AK830_g8334 [Neonectria ditissima]|uniref:Uncharacterized protein n=1 Tax=Neonectria ditissima TaxID=78410 RepID=A0A0P7BBM8_9HYPO|nr:hypothetical protein AK830_g8334 [Neonectria ditissima]
MAADIVWNLWKLHGAVDGTFSLAFDATGSCFVHDGFALNPAPWPVGVPQTHVPDAHQRFGEAASG